MTCLVGTLESHQTVVLCHGVRRYWQRGPGAHFGSITFCSMIFGRVIANIRHGRGSRTVAFRPFLEVVRCGVCVFLAVTWRRSKKSVPLFLRVPLILGSSLSQKSLAQWFGNLLSATALALPCVASLESHLRTLP
jgi:hypothetical protein